MRPVLLLLVLACGWTADMAPVPLKPGDFVLRWHLRGPFPNPASSTPLGDESAFARKPVFDSEWKAVTLDPGRFGDNFHDHLGAGDNCFAYAIAAVESPIDQDAKILLGSDDGYTLWLNGEIVGADMDVGRGVTPDQDRVPVSLRKGRNLVMLKVTQGVGGWGFCVRFAALDQAIMTVEP